MFEGNTPKLKDLRKLSRSINDYPVNIDTVIDSAYKLKSNGDMIAFLELFIDEGKTTFDSRRELFERTSELAMIIQEEREQIFEHEHTM